MKDIVVLGAGGFAREVAWLIEEINAASPTWRVLGFSDVDPARRGAQVGKWTVEFSDDELTSLHVALAVGIGDPNVLLKIRQRFGGLPPELLPNLVHPSVHFDRDRVSLGRGNIICAGNVLTTDISIGSLNIVNLSCTIGHDVRIEDCCVMNPGCNVSGGVEVGTGTLLGTGATILQNRRLGERVVVGGGALVTKDVEDGLTVVGVPAKPLVRGGAR